MSKFKTLYSNVATGAALLCTSLAFASAPAPAPIVITLDDVVKKVSTENYEVYENALRVYQSRQAVKAARGNLLPKLNLWKIASFAMNPINLGAGVDLIEDIAPFLVPANWFRKDQAKQFYLAEQEGYRALWANEVMTAKGLYFHLLLDQELLQHIDTGIQELKNLHVIVKSHEVLGATPLSASRDIETRILGLQEDRRSLEVLITSERSSLAYLMGLSVNQDIVVTPIAMPEFEKLEPLNYEDFEFRAVDSSPEVRQFDYFVKAADSTKKEVTFSFLGSTKMSRGLAGGVFDYLPEQDGLGFGTPASFKIAKAQKETLKLQKIAAQETVKRHLALLVQNYNLDLESYANSKRRVELALATNEELKERLSLGQDIDVLELVEGSRNHIQADTALFAVKFRFLSSEDRLARLIFHGDYSKQPVVVNSLEKEGTR